MKQHIELRAAAGVPRLCSLAPVTLDSLFSTPEFPTPRDLQRYQLLIQHFFPLFELELLYPSGMEILARNLPPGMTERSVKNFLRPHLANVGIKTYHCHKVSGKTFAKLTFADRAAAALFLQLHGQSKHGKEGFATVKVKLFYLRKPVNICESSQIPDRFLLSSLESEEATQISKRGSRTSHHTRANAAKRQRSFGICRICCGQWGYIDQRLIFYSHFQEDRVGQMVFGRRSVVIDFYPKARDIHSTLKYQIEIPYSSVESFTAGIRANPTVTFSVAEAPKFFEVTDVQDNEENLAVALHRLGLQPSGSSDTKATVPRMRITALSKSHELVVSSCLCYRFTLSRPEDMEPIAALKHAREIPPSITWNTAVVASYSFGAQMTKLNNALTGKKFEKFPFGLKFQLQRLAQNGYLTPLTVVALMDFVASESQGISMPTTTKAVRRLLGQIPYAGPYTEATHLELKTLTELLVENQHAVARESSYSSAHLEHPEHICDVYKAIVTPAGTYLHGPEPEMKNRILRKYSEFSSYFLQVSFLDENEEPIRYDRHTSNDAIYHGRFQKILQGVINIAGRGYEFLGFSHSSLRAQTCYFMAPFTMEHQLLHARNVIAKLGDFSEIRSPAKCAARSKSFPFLC